ncbi:DUF362 domain-containing protein [Natrinema halophilum]|uniref:DUF362 domain-containing protein n=1 Tax=Natrinema halophilum TaxID=1699371 RepID=A0A7D5GLF5_9EURY|nr:DUF362 domain-containing protein [Natrinema halophilum]QLG49830.1 DUF362 domain-containing protein [Natrinema halophilum]
MEFPEPESFDSIVGDVTLPPLARVQYDPPTPSLSNPTERTRKAVESLPLSTLQDGATVAIGIGSRGIHDIVEIATSVVDSVRDAGFDPVVVPAMGSHGGATPEGQRETLAALGISEETLDCPIDARMDTAVLGRGDLDFDVHFSEAALEADACLVVNRVKAHTNFTGDIESGLCKMLTIGLGKQKGADTAHANALVEGYEAVIRDAVDIIRREAPVVGGIAIVENFADEVGLIEGVSANRLLEREPELLTQAHEWMPTLPYDELDVLVVDRFGKDISGSGMDTNVIGRYQILNEPEPETPQIKRIYLRNLSERSHGNGNGLGLADITRRSVIDDVDLQQVYANTLTSNSLSKAKIPLVAPDDELALTAAVSTIGPYDPETARIAWIEDTSSLTSFRVSPALLDDNDASDHISVVGWDTVTFEDGSATFLETTPPTEDAL